MIVPAETLHTLKPEIAAHYTEWADYMEHNIDFSLKASPIHTKAHAERVLLYALIMAHDMRDQLPENAWLMLAHAAVFHDTRRQDDGYDVGHGARAAAHYKKYAEEHPEVSFFEEAYLAMAYHDRDDDLGYAAINKHFCNEQGGEEATLIYQIFKDADALDRFRLGDNELNVDLLRTPASKELVEFARELVSATTYNDNAAAKMLLIVDPQYDFITGTLPVPGAEEGMNALAAYIEEHASDYDFAVVTSDWHPFHHSSFLAQGGPWPEHCVQHSQGAAVYQPLLQALNKHMSETVFLYKGDDAGREEYSIFDNKVSANHLSLLIGDNNVTQIDVCGLAGDVCVLNTWQGGRSLHSNVEFRVLEQFSPSLDGGATLRHAIEESKESAR